MKVADRWLERFVELIQNDPALHDATVKLVLAAAENEMSKAEARRARTRSKQPN